MSPEMQERRMRIQDGRKTQQFEREKRKVMDNLKKIRERRNLGLVDSGDHHGRRHDNFANEGGTHASQRSLSHHRTGVAPVQNAFSASTTKTPTKGGNASATASKQANNDESFIAKTIEHAKQENGSQQKAVPVPNISNKRKNQEEHPSTAALHNSSSASLISHSSSIDVTSSMPSFNDWLKRQNSQKQMALPDNSPKSFDDWKQNRGKIRKELEETRKELSMQLTRRASLSPINTSPLMQRMTSPQSPNALDEGVSPIPVPRISHHIYRTSPSSPSPSTERKNRPWNQNKLERRPSLARMRSTASTLSRGNASEADTLDQHIEDYISDESSSTLSVEDHHTERTLFKLNQKYEKIAKHKTQVLEKLKNSSSTKELHRELSSLRLMTLQQGGGEQRDEE